jgi:hypothetical protein
VGIDSYKMVIGVEWVDFEKYIFPIMKSPNPHWNEAIPILNFFFSLSINEILIRIFVLDTHQTLFAV